MAITSRFYYKNILKRADDGIGDGTKYATATGATVDQDNKQLTLAGFSILNDLGADANDLFNSMILYFTSSGNKYHIVDWDAATDVATVFETPDENDTGASEIRLNLRENASSASNPVHRLADGKKHTKWMGSGAAQAQTIQVLLPNLIEDGGFERQAVGNLASPWTAETTQWQVAAAAALLGSRMAVYTKAATDDYLTQDLTGSMTKGKTYRIVLKAQALTGNPSGNSLLITIYQKNAPYKRIQTGLDWYPTITTAAAWFEKTLVADFSSDNLMLHIDGLGLAGSWGTCTGIRIDEIYIYEDIAVDRLIVSDHTFNNGEITSIYGCRCWPGRTSFAYGNDASANLAAAVDIDQTEPVVQSLTLSNYPVWEIKLTSATGITYEAGVLFLCPQMAFTRQMNAPFDQYAEETAGVMNETAGGRRAYHKDFHRGGPYGLTFTNVNSSFYNNLKDWWEEVGRNRFPFFFCFDETVAPEDIKYVRCDSDFLFAYNPVRRDGGITLREEL